MKRPTAFDLSIRFRRSNCLVAAKSSERVPLMRRHRDNDERPNQCRGGADGCEDIESGAEIRMTSTQRYRLDPFHYCLHRLSLETLHKE